MDSTALSAFRHFRQGLHGCFERAADALMDTCDALLTQSGARSFAELSLSPCFRRRWASLYAALEDAQVERTALRQVFADALPCAATGTRRVLGIDASPIVRAQSHTAKDRTYVHTQEAPRQGKGKSQGKGGGSKAMPNAVGVGWNFSALAVLPESASSWIYLLDNKRIASSQTPAEVAAEQLAAVVPLLAAGREAADSVCLPLLTGDRYYGSATFVAATRKVACDKLLRIQSHRVFYHPAPPPSGRRGAPRKDGARFKCSASATHGPPDQQWQGLDDKGHKVEVTCWQHLHFQKCREVPLSVVRVVRHSARDTKRDPRESWFIWVPGALAEKAGLAEKAREVDETAEVPLDEIVRLYGLRFSLEHGFRFEKQSLLWDKPRLRSPEQFQRWTDVVAAAHNQLVLARPLVQAHRQPWERPCTTRASTPQQVRRAMGRIMAELGTPARPPQPRGKSPGRQRGAIIKRADRFPVVYKAAATTILV